MASPDETKLSEQQSSNSNPTTPPAPVVAESPRTKIAENQAQEDDEEVILAPRADASDTENHHFEQAQRSPSPVAPDTAVEDTRAGIVESQQQDPIEMVATLPATAATSNDVASHDEEDSDPDSEEWPDFEFIEGRDNDRSVFRTPPNSPTGQ